MMFLQVIRGIDIPEIVIRSESLRDVQTFLADFENLDLSSSIITKQETAVCLGDWKLIEKLDGVLELYNLYVDPGEKENLISQWSGLTKTEQLEIFPLFNELGMELPVP